MTKPTADRRRDHHSLDRRMLSRKVRLISLGKDPNQASEMLDLYLAGDSAAEIAVAYGVNPGSVYSAIAKEALYRLMKQRSAERLEEMDEVLNGDTNG